MRKIVAGELTRLKQQPGKRLFEDSGGQIPLELVDSRALKGGVVSLTYRPA